MTDANESWKETSSSRSGRCPSSTSAASAIPEASENGRPTSPAPSAATAIQAERSVATASPVTRV